MFYLHETKAHLYDYWDVYMYLKTLFILINKIKNMIKH